MTDTQTDAPVRGAWSRGRLWLRLRRQGGRALVASLALGVIAAIVATFHSLPDEGVAGPIDSGQTFTLLVLDLVLLLALATVVAWQVVRFWAKRRRGTAGAQLHVRFVTSFSLVALTPAVLVAVLSALFLNYELRAWFSDRVKQIVDNSYTISETYLEEHNRSLANEITAMASDVARANPYLSLNPRTLQQYVYAQAALRHFPETIVFDGRGRVLARSGMSMFGAETQPTQADVFRARQEGTILLPPIGDRVRAITPIEGFADVYLYASRLVDEDVVSYLERTRSVVQDYQAMQARRAILQNTLVAIYVLVALVLLLTAVAVGLALANRLTRPIGELIEAAERVGAGDLEARVAEPAKSDEVGRLMRAFNTMTGRLASQQREVFEATRQLDERRRFTEAVLAGVSAGVIGVDAEGKVELPNRAAANLLGRSIESLIGVPLAQILPQAEPLVRAAARSPDRIAEAQIEFAGEGRPRTLMVRVAQERAAAAGEAKGYVVTFDDVTELLNAQRQAAWADVARRIAHEIKNPLTPIQLSAERLKRRYLGQIAEDPETFVACTDTIVRQVGDIGRMVDEFSAFARMPAPVLRREDLGALVRQAVFLQAQAHPEIEFSLDLPENPLAVACDARQVGQALTNILKNAAEAIAARPAAANAEALPPGEITVRLRHLGGQILVAVEDNGCGLPEADIERLTEPYVTRREKGTGLGLAIVKKVMEDHRGQLYLARRAEGGARVTLAFPEPTPSAAPERERTFMHGA